MRNDDLNGCLIAAYYVGFWVACISAWLTAVIQDASHGKIAWVLVDILVSPIGAFRGLMYWVT